MQKIFIKYTVFILSSAIALILFINFLFNWHMLEDQQADTFRIKIEQIIHTLENNQMELELMNKNLDEDYLTRAKAAAYVLDVQEEVAMSVPQMQYLARLLNVDELHYIDPDGIIASASVSRYIGMDMADHEQTAAFLALLESDDEDAFLIQEARPNASEGKIMQYVGVARKNGGGIVQVGFEPQRQMEAQARNTYDYIFSRFPTDPEEEFFAVDSATGDVLGHSEGMDQIFAEECYQLAEILTCAEGAYKKGRGGRAKYVMSQRYGDVIICAALSEDVLRLRLRSNTLYTLVYLLSIGTAVILILSYLVRQKVVNGIHRIIESLSAITEGDLDRTVEVGGNREFEELSQGINTMVKSIVNISNRMSVIIEMSGIPLAAFEYESSRGHVFATSGLRQMLDITERRASELCQDPGMFDRYICWVTKKAIDGEEDVYQLDSAKYVRVHMSEQQGRKLGVIMDVTGDIREKERMRYENTHDALTQLYKYARFQELAREIVQGMTAGEGCAAVMIDLDHFKGINDIFGHDAGDRYLQAFADVLRAMDPEHFLCARRSGDEFCMLIHGCGDRDDVVGYLDYFYKVLAENPAVLSGPQTRTISASAGFVWTMDAGADIAELIARADAALYKVKKDAKGTYGASL